MQRVEEEKEPFDLEANPFTPTALISAEPVYFLQRETPSSEILHLSLQLHNQMNLMEANSNIS
jgi:hypothetical protein